MIRFSRIFPTRVLGALTIFSFTVMAVPAVSEASVAAPSALASAALAAPAATGSLHALASDASACDRVSATDVANDVARLRALRAMRHVSMGAPAPHLDPDGYRAFVLRTYPRQPVMAMGTAHAMTATEYATYRAVSLVASGKMKAIDAVRACRAQAAAVARVRPAWQCGQDGCPKPIITVVAHDSGGNAGRLTTTGGSPTAATTTSSTGATIGSGTVTAVSLSGMWIANPKGAGSIWLPGPIPSMQTTRNESYKGKAFSYTFVEPDPGWVPQNGWLIIPGTSFWAYLDNTNKFIVMQLDGTGNDYIEAFETASGGFQLYYHVLNSTGQVVSGYSTIDYSGATGTQAARTLGMIRPDGSPSEALLGLGGIIAAIGIGIVALAPAAGILAGSAAALGIALIVEGAAQAWDSQYVTDGTVSTDCGIDDGYADFGDGDGGYSDDGIDEDIF